VRWIVRIIEDEIAVRRVELDQDFMSGILAAYGIVLVLAADADLAGLTHFAPPGEGGQVSVDTLEVKERQFVSFGFSTLIRRSGPVAHWPGWF